MKKVTFVIEAGNVDIHGDILKIEGVKIPDKVHLLRNFDHSAVPIGKCEVFKEDGVLKAEAEIPDELLNAYPAIGFSCLSHHKDENGNTVIDDAKLLCVSLCDQPNADPSIKRISDQLK